MTSPLDWIREAASARADAGLTRRLVPTKAHDVVDLAGNDYLGLRHHPAVVAGAVAAVETYGTGAGASRLVTGTLDVHEELEAALAALTGAPSALVLSSGYAANLAALTTLADAGTLVVSDEHAHASLIDGCRLSRAAVSVSRHNDLEHVAELLARRDTPRAVVVAESVYSVLGDAAPVEDLVALTAEAGALLVVDEAHALGVVGPGGAGLVAAAGASGAEHVVVTTTLSKSLAAQGGVVLASPDVRDHLVNTARPFIYDTGLAPGSAGAALAALGVLREHPELPARLHANAARLAETCGVAAPDGAVMSVPMPGPHETVEAVERAAALGVRVGAFRPPSTPDGSSRLRITAHADHTDHDLDRACAVLAELVPSQA
ncbi:8-amino-7-oxononanoate synthase [Phycicoccus sonneratiae]|uniref:8-amino-7-oxononanoate synthase n=1 Tax=Phycicoccus sonneratiae TaxID=2807628 RepID=A0ABS2CP66_9MICO|nr:8-amino-7-oxononanoate synthase [Phycicoccus sonneraticus]MBM6401672.1 8-amino-7-oxononanoate synthase [Phycicoccus sonneraticus]